VVEPGRALDKEPGRNVRRKQRTRDALIAAAQSLLAEGADTTATIQTITDRADVGFGTFYNHFADRAELFDAARRAAFDQYRAWRRLHGGDEADPVRRLATNIRLTGRLAMAAPEVAAVLLRKFAGSAAPALDLTTGLADDILAAAGNGAAAESDVLVPAAAGAIEAVIRASVDRTPAEQARMADALAHSVLRMIGVPEDAIAAALAHPIDPHPDGLTSPSTSLS
jgi:AcrR family transcriptional regulator